jgi:hypothetical protein
LIPPFEHLNILGSYRIGIGHAWCCRKAYKRCSLAMVVELLKKNKKLLPTGCPTNK